MDSSLSILNENPQVLPGPPFLHQLISWDQHQRACALRFLSEDGKQWNYSYQDLRRHVTSFALRIRTTLDELQTQGSIQEPIIPVLIPQSPGLYIAILAILEAGGAFCPINLDAPRDRIKFIAGDVSSRVIVTTSAYEDTLRWNHGPAVLLIEEFPADFREVSPQPIFHDVQSSRLAYVMYTSGSTGTPKGVAVSHLAASQSILAHDRHIPPFTRFLQFASPSFDVSVFEIFFPLFRGSTLVGCSREKMLNDLPGTICNLGADAAELTPTVVGSLIQTRSKVPTLKLLLTIGEMLTRLVVDSFGTSESSEGILYGMYGPTEAAIHCTINSKMKVGAKIGGIGVPLDTVSTFIMSIEDSGGDNSGTKILPVGEAGELVLGGPQLAEGYLNRADQNAAAFVRVHGQIAYRTGDKARMLADGTIEVLGRIVSGQVKLRGQRVELGEIEEAVYKYPGVSTAFASVIQGILIVFALQNRPDSNVQGILDVCAKWLPKFMVPNEVVLVNNFPYLPSGKINKRELESEYLRRRSEDEEDESQLRTATERKIVDIIQDLLETKVGVKKRLRGYGVDSLLAIRLAPALRSNGFSISPVDILRAETVESLAKICDSSRKVRYGSTSLTGNDHVYADLRDFTMNVLENAEDVEVALPCTPTQDAMISETTRNKVAYKNHFEVRLRGCQCTNDAILAISTLAQHNSILRTGFVEFQNPHSTYAQVVRRKIPEFQIQVVNCLTYEAAKLPRFSTSYPLNVQVMPYEGDVNLLFHMHHALYDAWSLELLLDDLNAIIGQEKLFPRPLFRSVLNHQLKTKTDSDLWPSQEYWRDHLALLNPCRLPNFHCTVDMKPGLNVSSLQTSIPYSNLDLVARALYVSPHSLFQAAFSIILSSYSGQKDICFGTVFSGRTALIDDIEQIVGPCLSTLPVRVDLTTFPSVEDLVRYLNSTNIKHLDHENLPLRDIKKLADLDPGNYLFDTLIIWQQTLHELDHQREYVDFISSTDYLEFNLTLEVTPGPDSIHLRANYERALFPQDQIHYFLQQMEHLVLCFIDSTKISLDQACDRMTDDLLSIENHKPLAELKEGSLSAAVELMAKSDPDHPAIDFAHRLCKDNLQTQRVTYGELNSKANQIAHRLLESHVELDDLVCICMEKSADLYISILAITKTGSGYLPLTPDTPLPRIEHIVAQAKVKLVLTDSRTRKNLKLSSSIEIISVDELELASFSPEDLRARSAPGHLAYCVFTSGSTGTPKGVLVTQGNLLGNLQVLEDLYPHSKFSRFLQSCSQAFDVSVFEIFFTWHIGACLCSATKDILFQDIEMAIRALNITHLSLTPTVAALINRQNVPGVEFLVTAGEAVTQKVFNAWSDRGLYQGYGPSETTNICTVRPKVSKHHSINNIGPPLKNTSVFVLSAENDFRILPRGGEGEFCFGGVQIGKGYLNAEQGTEKFVDHPEYGRLYRSGDFGRLLADGSLEFTGRKDDQVKIRGQRVELGEINSIMLGSSHVQDCVTLVVSSERGHDQRLICFWTSSETLATVFKFLTPEREIIEKLYDSLQSELPGYMIPSALISVSCLPATSQGKIDKRLLVQQFKLLSVEYIDHVTRSQKIETHDSCTEIERSIATALSVVANVPDISIRPETSFFSLGIDSISAITLSRILRETHAFKVEISDILKYPSISRLAARLTRTINQVNISQEPSLRTGFTFDSDFVKLITASFADCGKEIERITPCTPLQEAMLSATEKSSSHAYENHIILDIRVDVGLVQFAWKQMIQRHEILRTCFTPTSHSRFAYAQLLLKESSYGAEIVQGTGNNIQAITEELKSKERGHSEFEPPYSLTFIQSSGQTRLLLSMHHALYDGYAMSILFEEMERTMRNDILPSRVSFFPFINYTISLDFRKAEDHWDGLLESYVPTPLASRAIDAAKGPNDPVTVNHLTSGFALSWIEDQVKLHQTSLLAVCQAAWASTLAAYVEQPDICFGNVVSGRTVPVHGVDRLVAPCFNTIPVRVKEMHKSSFLELFRILQSQSVNAMPFQMTPLRRIQSRSTSEGKRLFDTLFILQAPARELDSSVWSVEEESGVMDLPIVLEITPHPERDSMELVLYSQGSVCSDLEASQLLKNFDLTLKRSLQNPRNQALSPSTKALCAASLDRQSLQPEHGLGHSLEETSSLTKLELEIRDVIANFTDVPLLKIGRHMSIYRLGLDSISAVQVATALRGRGHNLLASDVLQHPTIKDLAFHLDSNQDMPNENVRIFDFETFAKLHRKSICQTLCIAHGDVEAIRPCTPVQCGMLAQTLHSGGTEYVNSFRMELEPGVSIAKLRQAWSSVMRNYDVLRTAFVEIDDPKHQFAMVCFHPNGKLLPWTELPYDENTPRETRAAGKGLTMELLRQNPWRLEVIHDEQSTSIQFTAHHAIYDAQSLQVILSAVARYYRSEEPLVHRPIEPLLAAILGTNTDNEIERREFWSTENKTFINRFPDFTPLHETSSRMITKEKFSEIPLADIEQLCRQSDVLIQVAGQVSWARLLSAYFGESGVTFGLTLSGRSVLDESEDVSFPSIVTLPASIDVIGTNKELLDRTNIWNAKLHKHQFTPLASIQKWSGLTEGKLFDTLFAYQKIMSRDEEAEKIWTIKDEQASAEYVVSIELQPCDNGLLLFRLTFKENLIPAAQAELMLRQLDALLGDTLQNPQNLASKALGINETLLSVTSAAQPTLSSSVQLLHEFVSRQAELTPLKTAFEFATEFENQNVVSRSWTYRQLDAQGNKIANLLIGIQAVQGELIAICFDKCPEASFAILGILKSGCAYVALDPNAPPERMKFILEDSKSKIILTAGKPAERIQEKFGEFSNSILFPQIIDLGKSDTFLNSEYSVPLLSRAIDPQDTCYCLYTSGTTGTPKGCEISHENAVQAMLSFTHLFSDHWTPQSKWLQFASFHFDVSVLELFWSWSVGICVVSAPRDLIFEDIPGAISQIGITHIDLTPSLARLVHPDTVPSLHNGVFITGGEQLKQEILDVWGEYGCIYNGYGPTEATIGVTMYPRVPKNGKPSNIGPQFLNVGSFVLKSGTSEPVLRGGVGELCVSGKLVGKGYLNRPDLTLERFPYLDNLGERVYRTGDLVRILYDGSFIFLGRADDQVKLRGQRLELTEINEVIKKNVKGLHEVVTLVLKHVKQQKNQLVTFFIMAAAGRDGSEAGFHKDCVGRMRNACKERLPGYMVPTHFIALKTLPLSANNKADSKQLASYFNSLEIEDLQKLDADSLNARDWTSAELGVVNVLAQLLSMDVKDIKSTANIFELGIDSISVIGFARSLQKSGYLNAKLSVVMRNPLIESLAKALTTPESGNESQSTSQIVASQRIAAFAHRHMVTITEELHVDPSMIEAVAPCTPAQEGMMYRFLDSDEALYFSHFDFELQNGVDEERLRLAWAKVASKLQMLRTKFVLTADGSAQVVLKAIELPWIKNNDLEEDIDAALESEHLLYDKIGKSAVLVEPYRISILDDGERRILTLSIFHGLYDGISLPMIFEKVYNEYHHNENEYGPSFHSILPFGPLATIDGAETFWKQILATTKLAPMQMINENPTAKNVSLSLTVTDLAHLEPLRKQLGVTYHAILQAVWSVAINTYLSANTTYGVVISGRTIDFLGAERVVGPLLNTIAFHVDMTPEMTWKDLIQAIHEFNTAVLPYQHTPLKDVQHWVGKGNNQPLFDTLFVFQRDIQTDSAMESLWKPIMSSPVADASIHVYPLAFEAELKRNGDIVATVVGQGSFLDETVASKLLAQVESGLHALLSPNQVRPLPEIAIEREIEERKHVGATEMLANGNPEGGFVWTAISNIMKSEISTLAAVAPSSVTPYSPIFSLGLDSIDVIKLASRLKKHGINIAVSDVIKSQTIANMVSKVSEIKSTSISTRPSLQEYEESLTSYLRTKGKLDNKVVAILPATPLQEGMVAEMISSEYERYFNREVFRVANGVATEQLKKSWDKVIEKFDILRTQFVQVADAKLPFSFAQVIRRPGDSIWREVSLEPTANLNTEIEKIFQSVVDFAAGGNLLQLTSITQGQDLYFVLSISHALYDGWSLQALHEDVRKAYYGKSISRPDPRSTLELILDTDGTDATRYWRTNLQGLSRCLFPNSARFTSQLVHRYERSSRHSLPKLQAFCRNANISLQTLGQTTWALLLASYLNSLDVSFGVVLSCRDTEEASEVMFPLMNTVAVRAVVHGTFDEMLHYMQDNSNSMRPYQHFPLRKAQALSGIKGSLFDTLFIYQGRQRDAQLDDKQLYMSVQSKSDVEFVVCAEMEISGEELIWRTACKDAARTSDETKKLIDLLDDVIGSIMEDVKAYTMTSRADGISICGLPSFSLESRQPTVNERNISAERIIDHQNWTPVGIAIRRILSEVSKVPERDISGDQTIFHLGLDSISAIKVSFLLRRENIRLSVNDIVKASSVTEMADYIIMRKPETQKSLDTETVLKSTMQGIDPGALLKASGIEEENAERILPLTAGQLYMLARYLASGGTEFFASFKYTASGHLDPQRLGHAWSLLLQRHSILRTVFIETGDKEMPLAQVTLKEMDNPIRWTPASRPINVDNSLLAPVGFSVEARSGVCTMTLDIHHALYDAVSLPLILSDLEALYSTPSMAASEPPSSFPEFISQTLPSTTSRREFWKSYLSNVPTQDRFPTVSATSRKRISIFHPSLPTPMLASNAQKIGLSTDSLLLAAIAQSHQRLLSSPSKPDFTVIGVYLSSRHLPTTDLSTLSSPTLNLLPLRINQPITSSIEDIARSAQNDLAELNRVEIVGTSLREIWELTGTRVGIWVNILKGGVEEHGEEKAEGESGIFKAYEAEDVRRARAEVLNVQPRFIEEAGDRMSRNKLLEAYIPAIDVEMRVVDGGKAVDLGIFAPAELLDLESGLKFAEYVREILRELGGG